MSLTSQETVEGLLTVKLSDAHVTEHPTSIVIDKVATNYPIRALYEDLRQLLAVEISQYGQNILGRLRLDSGGVANRVTILVWLEGEKIRERVVRTIESRGYECSIHSDDPLFRHEERESALAGRKSIWDCMRV